MTPSSPSVPALQVAVVPQQTATPLVPSTMPADFMLVLSQLLGAQASAAPAESASVSISTEPATVDEELSVDDAHTAGALDLLPLALPMIPVELRGMSPKVAVDDTQSSTMMKLAAGASPAVAAEAQLLSEMIQSGPSTTREPMMSFDMMKLAAGTGASPAVAAEAQLLSEMIQFDPPVTREPMMSFDAVQLPAANDVSQAHRASPVTETPWSRPVHTPVGSAEWSEEIGARLTMMADAGKQSASLRLSPEHLGPLEIRIAIHDDQASVWFGAAHADTRAAIETALPRLREMLEAQGLSLADAGVFREPPRDAQAGTSGSDANLNADGAPMDEQGTPVAVRVGIGLVDAYA